MYIAGPSTHPSKENIVKHADYKVFFFTKKILKNDA